MLNEERVILMTRLASYESGEGKEHVATGSYFRSDYIRVQIIKSILSASITFFMIVALIALADFETIMSDIYMVDLFEYGKMMLFWYVAFVGIYVFITYVVYTIRYRKARKGLKNYYNNLKNLSEMYENRGPKGNRNE